MKSVRNPNFFGAHSGTRPSQGFQDPRRQNIESAGNVSHGASYFMQCIFAESNASMVTRSHAQGTKSDQKPGIEFKLKQTFFFTFGLWNMLGKCRMPVDSWLTGAALQQISMYQIASWTGIVDMPHADFSAVLQLWQLWKLETSNHVFVPMCNWTQLDKQNMSVANVFLIFDLSVKHAYLERLGLTSFEWIKLDTMCHVQVGLFARSWPTTVHCLV